MKTYRILGWAVGWMMLCCVYNSAGTNPQGSAWADEQPPPIPPQEQPEVLISGPVHEAYAEPVSVQTQEPLTVQAAPPAPIEEIPPLEAPVGGNFAWVPGYWSWDMERNGHIWVSACWRAAPPNMQWVPGYWAQSPGGWEWVPGYWAPAGQAEVEYLPPPPEMLVELNAPGPATGPDEIWIPACWYWRDGRYVLRHGYWMVPQQGWIWVPSHYVRTPRGFLFAEGHWDFTLERRGVLFAPVYFPRQVYARAGFTYSPSVVININILSINLFVQPRSGQYYFGDYYAASYQRAGIYPVFESERLRTWYDPIYVHDRWRHRADPRWQEQTRREFDLRVADKNLRPARTYREMETRLAQLPVQQRAAVQLAQPLAAVFAAQGAPPGPSGQIALAGPVKFERINKEQQQEIVQQATKVHKFSAERSRWESPAAGPKADKSPAKVTMPAEHRGPAAPPAGPKVAVPPIPEPRTPGQAPPDRRDQAPQPPERQTQAPAPPPPERKKQDNSPPEQKAPPPPPERNAPAPPPPERKKQDNSPPERKKQDNPPPERKDPPPPPERKKQDNPPPEHKAPAPPPEQSTPAPPPPERKKQDNPPPERKKQDNPPPERKDPPPPPEQSTPAPPPPERKKQENPPPERKKQENPPPEHK